MEIDRRFPPGWSAAREMLYQKELAAVFRTAPMANRRALHKKALGYNRSHVDFTDIEFGKILEAFRAISNPADLFSELEALDRQKCWLVLSIRRAALKLNITVAATAEQSISELEFIRDGLSGRLAATKRLVMQ